MDLYHSWIYIHLLNATWFIWTMVWIVFGLNILSPVLLWFIMSGRPIPFLNKLWPGSRKGRTNASK